MVIVRSPLRITLGGGGTDLKSYYKYNNGEVLSAAIDKYVYISINTPFKNGIFLKYSNIENVNKISEISHGIIRAVLEEVNLEVPQIEISSFADIPSGTGLGSSGSFTTALLKAVHIHQRKNISQEELAKLACYIEIEKLKQPIGKQDQYISAYGGLNCFKFKSDETVNVEPLKIAKDVLCQLEDNLMLFYTGQNRSASEILLDQNEKSLDNNVEMLKNLDYIKDLGIRSRQSLESGNLFEFSELMNEHWLKKRERSKNISNTEIDVIYEIAMKNGASSGKLVGAGGGGFLLLHATNPSKLRSKMLELGLREVRFKFDFEGTKVMVSP